MFILFLNSVKLVNCYEKETNNTLTNLGYVHFIFLQYKYPINAHKFFFYYTILINSSEK